MSDDSKLSDVRIYYQNVRGLRTKTTDFFKNSYSTDYDAIALSETSLNASFFDSELFNLKQFCVYRTDRSKLNSVHQRFGGVLIAVRASFPSERIHVPGTDNVEMILVRLQCRTHSIYICCVYIPSGSKVEVYNEYCTAFGKIFGTVDFGPTDEICILGDFNLSDVKWIPDYICDNSDDLVNGHNSSYEPNVLLPSEVGEGSKADVIYLLLSNNLHQVNDTRNVQENILDLVFYSDPNNIKVSKTEVAMSRVDSYHYPVEIVISTDIDKNIEYNESPNEFNFKKGDYIGLNNYLNFLDLTQLISATSDVDDKVDVMYDVLLDAFGQFIPLKKKMVTDDPPWYNQRLRNLKNRTSKANKRYKSETDPAKKLELKMIFLSVNKEFHTLRDAAFNRYLANYEEMLISNPKKFWSYVKSRKKTTGYPSMMFRGNMKSSNPVDSCSLFAEFFESVYVTDNESSSDLSGKFYPIDKRIDIGSISLTINDIVTNLHDLDTDKGNGPDNISPVVLKNCAESLAFPLLHIFNSSLSTSKFPTRWKTSYLTPIFKSGSRGNVENYRGVAILPTIGKLFESIVTRVLTEKFRKIISKTQHGFMKYRSTATNLVEFVSYATKVMESNHQLDVIYTDFKKAFDRVKHSILLYKLNQMGVHSSLLAWISSYLSGRSQFVKLAGWSSRTFSVTSGVPQGSHLGPLLFILFMDDVTEVFQSSTCLLYADDLKIFKKIKNVLDASALQRDLNRFLQWCDVNQLYLNTKKCNVISFTRKRSKIEFGYSVEGVLLTRLRMVKDLGILMDEKLTFSKHVDYIIAKAYSMLGFVIRTCRDFKNVNTLKSLYFAHVRSYLEYASVVWHPYQSTFIDRIESIQKKFLMFALRRTVKRDENHKLPPYIDRCESINIEPLARRRINACTFFTSDLLNGNLDAPNIASKIVLNPHPVRADDFLIVSEHRTKYGQHEPINDMCTEFNRFSQLWFQDIPRVSFKTAVKQLKIPVRLNGKIKIT